MKITIPIYIEQLTSAGTSTHVYSVRPLFMVEPQARDEELQRAVTKLSKELRRMLDSSGRQMRHSDLMAYSFAPEFEDQLLKLTLDLKTRTVQCRFLFVTLKGLDRRLAFTPSLPDLWFEIDRNETLLARATDVLTRFFRGKDKIERETPPKPEEVSVEHKAWATTLDLSVNPPLLGKTRREEFRAMLGGGEVLDGEWELQQTGRCLDWLFPDELNRITGREHEIAELERLLKAPDRRPVLLVGPRQAGKTALVEEFVYRVVEKRKSPFSSKKNVWLIAPQRLISGMSYVGQWENRLLAILKEAKKREHILYFDDLLGLFKAGLSRDASLNVGQVIKPYLERREVRVLGEITPEAWRVLRERDRGLADMFHLLPVPEPSEEETFEMLLGLNRELERKHRCRFELEALPAVIDLQRRYVRDAAFPGKAAAFLSQIAVKHRGAEINFATVLLEFHAKTGLALWFIKEATVTREYHTHTLGELVIGQKAAVEAITDAIMMAKARLNDPDRPLACFLFLGPTGVGKTQCAKSLAQYLFTSEEKLLRFDMNEFNSPASVARLVGAFDQPEGLLTSAVRRQPFSVILLDEIEKAHRDVFNLLLQVMGDGRLTDALGRTTDFTNCILILTSNLGAKEASSELGFSTERAKDASIYVQAAEKFFSPEFFNRLDRVVPFERLSRQAIEQIASKLIGEIFRREGLVRRRNLLVVDQLALARIVDAGYHPQLGARALKRAVEKQLTQPIAARLAGLPPAAPTLIEVLPARQGLRIELQELKEAQPQATGRLTHLLEDPGSTLDQVEDFIDRIEGDVEAFRPEGAIPLDSIQPEHQRYFSMQEQIRTLHRASERLNSYLATSARASTRLSRTTTRAPRRYKSDHTNRAWEPGGRQTWRDLFAAEDLNAYLREIAAVSKSEEQSLRDLVGDLVCEAKYLSLLAKADAQKAEAQILMLVRPLQSLQLLITFQHNLSDALAGLFRTEFGLEVTQIDEQDQPSNVSEELGKYLLIRGPLALPLAKTEEGTHLFITHHDFLAPIQVKVFQVSREAAPTDAIRLVINERRRRREQFAVLRPDETIDLGDPLRWDEVIRVYSATSFLDFINSFGPVVDLRSGLTTPGFPTARSFRAFALSMLELPEELQSFSIGRVDQ